MRVSIHFPDSSFISYPTPDATNLAIGTPSTYIGDNTMIDIKTDAPMSVTELADYLKVSKQQVRKMIVNKEIKSIKVGREYRVMESDVRDWLDKQRGK